MTQKQFLLKGTFFLTAAGAATRILGFFYRIFLSRAIGAEEIGIFHLTMPVCAFCMAAASGGIQTAISRYCAEDFARNDKKSADRTLFSGLLVSCSLSVLTAVLVYWKADWIAKVFLAEKRCAVLLRILAFSLPFSVLHTCLGGYFIGRKQVKVPSFAQIAEQLCRIGSVLIFCHIMTEIPRPSPSWRSARWPWNSARRSFAPHAFSCCHIRTMADPPPKTKNLSEEIFFGNAEKSPPSPPP